MDSDVVIIKISMIFKVISYFIPWGFIKKWKMFFTLISCNSLRFYLERELKHCGSNVRIFRPQLLLGLNCVSIGDNFKMGFNGIIAAWEKHNNHIFHPTISIGNNVSFGSNCHIASICSVTIGSGVLCGSYILISDHSHGAFNDFNLRLPPNERELISKGPIIIEENVWIGDKVTILPNVIVGKNSIIGANSVVTKSMPCDSVICGNPARVVKSLNNGK